MKSLMNEYIVIQVSPVKIYKKFGKGVSILKFYLLILIKKVFSHQEVW